MVDDDDLSVWHAEIEDVVPRAKERAPIVDITDDFDAVEELFPPRVARVMTDVLEDIEAIVPAAPKLFVPDAEAGVARVSVHRNTADMISGSANGIDARMLKKLAQGQIPFMDRLDLHGFNETQAWAAVQDFLHETYALEYRCVLIIHGKGKGYGDAEDMGVIKANIAGWLVNHPRVLAFNTAHPKDGGRGAIYVYLRRQK